ncbi:actin binding protein [Pelomyxa schiedti]|nr:actin binding protein [Pelomyxa schiedti]
MLTLRVNIPEKSVTRSLRFNRTLSVGEALVDITEKAMCGGADHGLFQMASEKFHNRYLLPTKTLGFYDLRNDDEVIFRKKTRAQKIKTIDENVRTVLVDDSKPAATIVQTMCERLSVKNWEEFSLQQEVTIEPGKAPPPPAVWNGPAVPSMWVDSTKSLFEQDISDTVLLIMKKRFFATDDQIDLTIPMAVHLVYLQLKSAIEEGSYPCQKDEGILLAAMRAQVQLHDYDPNKWDAKKLKKELIQFLPPRWQKTKKIGDEVFLQYKQVRGVEEVQAKFRYIQLARSLKTYGLTIFPICMNLKEFALGIKRDAIQIMNPETFEVIKGNHLNHIKRWGGTDRTCTLDFGEYDTQLMKFDSPCAKDINSLLAGYVDIALKARREKAVEEPGPEVQQAEASALPVMYQVGKKKQGSSRLIYNTAGSFDPNTGGKKVVASAAQLSALPPVPSQDLPSARKALTALVEDLAASPSPATRVSGLTPEKWRSQLGTSFQSLGGTVEDLMKLMTTKPVSREALLPTVKQIMVHANEMGSSAKFAIPEGNSPVSLLEASKLVTSAMAGILSVAEECNEGQAIGAEHMNAMKIAQAKYNAAVAYMNAAISGKGVVDGQSLGLLTEYGQTLVDGSNQLLDAATVETINTADAAKRTALLERIEGIKKATISAQTAIETFGSAILAPICRAQITDSVDPIRKDINLLLELCNTMGLDPSSAVQQQAQALLQSLNGLLQATACAEPVGTTNPEFVNTFAEAFTEMNTPFQALKDGLGSRATMDVALKSVGASVNKVVASGKNIAGSVKDPELRLKLETAIRNVSDMFNKLYASCQECADNPDDKAKQEAIMTIAMNLQASTQDMATLAGGLAAGSNLRGFSKGLIESSLCLISAAKTCAKYLPESQRALLMKPANALSATTTELLDATLASVKDPFSLPVQQKVLAASQKSCIPTMTMVVAALKAAPKIKNFTAKQDLIHQSEKAKQAAQALMKATQAFKDLTGQTAVEEVTEQLASTGNDLDGLLASVQNGTLTKITDRHANEDAMALLTLSAKTLSNEASFVATSAQNEPRMLAARSRAAANSTVQVITAIKALVPTIADKQQQLRLTLAAKSLSQATTDLFNTATTVVVRPTAEGIAALESSLERVKASLAELTATDANLHEIDEAINVVKAQMALLKPATGVTVPLATAIERVTNCAKALSAGVSQVATLVQTNPGGVGAAVQVMSSTVPSLVEATNIAAGATDNPKAQEEIIKNTRNLLNQYGTALAVARKQTGKSAVDTSLLDASKAVANSLNKLMRTFGAVSNRDCEEALEVISESSQDLTNFSGVTHISPSAAVRDFAPITRSLTENTVAIVSKSRTAPGAMTAHARAAADNVRQIVDVARAMIAPEENRIPENLVGPLSQLKQSIAKLVEAKDAPQQMVAAVQGIQKAMNVLLTFEKEAEKTANAEKLTALQHRAGNLNKGLAKIAHVTKLAASGSPDGKNQLKQVGDEFLDAAEKLIGEFTVHTSQSSEALAADKSEKMVAAVKELCGATTQLVFSSMSVSAKPGDKEQIATLTENGLVVSEAVKKFMKLASSAIAGADTVENCNESLRAVIGEVASASMAVAVGTLGDTPADTPHQKLQEMLVQQAKVVMNSIGQVEAAARFTSGAAASAAQECTTAVKKACTLAIQAASTSPDPDLQAELVSNAQLLAESSLQLVQHAFTSACNPSVESLQAVHTASEAATAAIGALASKLSAGASMHQEVDEALKVVERAMADSNSSAPVALPENASYQTSKDEITNTCKNITAAVKTLIASDKTNLVQMGNTVKAVADMCSVLVSHSKQASALAPEPAIAQEIKSQTAALISSAHSILQTVQEMMMDPKNATLLSKVNETFKQLATTTAALLQAAKKGAKGEAIFEEALELLKTTLAQLDRAALFASAGQLDEATMGITPATATPARGPPPTSAPSPPGTPSSAPQIPPQVVDLHNAARTLMAARARLIDSSKLTDVALGEACNALAQAFVQFSKETIGAACHIKDMVSQQELVGAGKSVCIACQALALTGRDAQRLKNTASLDNLGLCNQQVTDTIQQLLRIATTALGDLARGSRNLETARATVSNLASRYTTLDGNTESQPKNVVDDARNIIAACSTLQSGITANDQDEVGRAAGFLSAAATNILKDAKGVHRLSPPPGVAAKLDAAVLETVRQVQVVLSSGAQMVVCTENEKSAKKATLEQNSISLVKSLQSIEQAIRQYPGGENLSIEEEEKEAADMETIAENELTRCAQVISEAAEKLLASRPVIVKKGGVKLDEAEINAIIMEGAHAIAVSCTDLVRNAATSQSARVQNLKSASVKYRADPTWSNGLISCAQKVVRAVQELIGAANKSKPVEEELIATTRAVVAATTQLVTASRVKADDLNSKDQQSLSAAAKSVVNTTVQLVSSAKKALTPPEDDEGSTGGSGLSFVAARNREIEMQIQMQQLEEQLRKTRNEMLRARKGQYATAGGKS